MKNIYRLRLEHSPTPIDPACRNFWRAYLAVVAVLAMCLVRVLT